MHQIKEEAHGDIGKMKQKIVEIVSQRGKMHNPVTNSGGVLLGRVSQIGESTMSTFTLKKGDLISPLASLSAIPLFIESVQSISSITGDQVFLKATAIMHGKCLYTSIPSFLSEQVGLAAIDISSLVPQVYRCVYRLLAAPFHSASAKSKITVLIIGCGKAGITSISCLRNKFSAHEVRILATDVSERQLELARCFVNAKTDLCAKVNAQNVLDMYRFASEHTEGRGADLVLNFVNVPMTESASIIAAREGLLSSFITFLIF